MEIMFCALGQIQQIRQDIRRATSFWQSNMLILINVRLWPNQTDHVNHHKRFQTIHK